MHKHTSIHSYLLGFAVAIVSLLMGAVLLFVSSLVSSSITGSVLPFLDSSTEAAARSASAGLQLESQEEVEAGLKPYAGNPLFTYVRVTNRTGTEVYVHRAAGLEAVSADTPSHVERNGELFETVPIQSDRGQLGSVTLGMSLTGRDAAVLSARKALVAIGFAALALMVL